MLYAALAPRPWLPMITFRWHLWLPQFIVPSMIVAVSVFVSVSVLDCFIFIFISCPCVKWDFVHSIGVFCSY